MVGRKTRAPTDRVDNVRRVPLRLLAIVLAEVVSILAVLLIAGHGPWAGPVLVAFSEDHGLNVGDVPVLLLWAAGLAACAALWRAGAP